MAWRRVYAQRPSEEAACPDDEALADLILDERGAENAGEDPRLEHVIRCPHCAQRVRDLLELHDDAQELSTPRRTRPWAVAAGFAILVAATLSWLLLAPPPDREGGAPEVLRGEATTVLPADGSSLAAPPAELSWPPQTGATAYRVELRSATGAILHRSPLHERTSLALPADLVAALEPGAYYWVVEVEGPVARPRLGPFWWTLTPASP